MAKTVVEEYSELYHYTNAEGLYGIISSQCLWATNISFLNDVQERVHYFDKRMPSIINSAILQVLNEMKKGRNGSALLERLGGYEKAVEEWPAQLIEGIREATLSIDEPYVTSFCGAKEARVAKHGLLSQWRAYGTDGGYAIVFDTGKLEHLLQEEAQKNLFLSLRWGDVNYHDADSGEIGSEEVLEFEEVIKNTLMEFIKSRDMEKLAPMYEAVGTLSCLTKHWGFHEEREVRIVATRGTKELFERARVQGESMPESCSVHHFMRGGVLVPYVRLFEGGSLPIKSIIVGPHQDKEKRKKSIESLLEQHGIMAEVTVSDIPYINR